MRRCRPGSNPLVADTTGAVTDPSRARVAAKNSEGTATITRVAPRRPIDASAVGSTPSGRLTSERYQGFRRWLRIRSTTSALRDLGADPRTIPYLQRFFDGVSVANNHSGDFGKDALAEQFRLLAAAKLPYFGGGADLSAAHRPWIVERNGLRLALLGYAEFKPRSFEASATRPGIAWSGEDEQVLRDIRDAREKYQADVVIPFLHWGWENEGYASERQKSFARRMIDAGASMVVGAHPHVTQGAESYKGKPIVYSLGNFVFDGFEGEARTGWLLRLSANKHGIVHWQTLVARLDEQGLPVPDREATSPCGDASGVRLCRGGVR